MNKSLKILQEYYGYDQFRESQAEIIDHVIAGGNSFVLMPTGSGKSLCYQIPALCREGMAIVVSPLIALMQDQITALEQLGISAGAINSSISSVQVSGIREQVVAGTLDLLYVAPERLVMPDFLDFIEQQTIALFAIDEAHCVSQWGHDFRKDYAELSLLVDRFPGIPRIALTATADAPTRKDIVERLGLSDGRVFISGFDRPNIHYTITYRNNPRQQVWNFIQSNHAEDNGIIYCISRKKVEEMASWLQLKGVNALPYHAGLSSDIRTANQARFLKEDKIVMVATIAFGMGIDKPDVRFVVHMNIPRNIEAYYQETGRAGRDGLPSNAYMIYGMDDVAMQRNWTAESNAPDNQKRIEHQKLDALLGLCEAAGCRRQVLLKYFDDYTEPCNNCDTCDTKPKTFDGTVTSQKALSCVHRTGERFGVAYVTDVLLGDEKNERITRFGHDQQSTYGIGAEHSKKEWQHIFRQLVALNLLEVDIAGHGGLSITSKGRGFLRETYVIDLRCSPEPLKSGKTKRSTVKLSMKFTSDSDTSLYTTLKRTRQELAQKHNVPAYVIFHDKTLVELAQCKPESLNQMLCVSGIGEAKLKRYGQVMLDVICSHVDG